jgi:hypothetical protein
VLTREQRRAQIEDTAEILRLYLWRREQLIAHAEASCFPKSKLELLLRGSGSSGTDVTCPSDKLAWVLGVSCVLSVIGKLPAYVLLARLTRRRKSAESSWEYIADEVDQPIADVKTIFRNAVPLFLAEFDARRMTKSYRNEAA